MVRKEGFIKSRKLGFPTQINHPQKLWAFHIKKIRNFCYTVWLKGK